MNILALLMVCSAGCGSPHVPGIEVVHVETPPPIATPSKLPVHGRAIPDFGLDHHPVPPRTMEPFKNIRVGMPITEVIMRCGLPDGDWGDTSGGTHRLIWDLDDGSWISIQSDGLHAVESIERHKPVKIGPRSNPSSQATAATRLAFGRSR
jgi:hypothetical protein